MDQTDQLVSTVSLTEIPQGNTILALQELLEDPSLEVLEQQVDRFNIFEVLGAVRVELRHSEFLAYLLDPIQNHGLGDLFTRRFLQAALTGAQSESIPVRPIDLALWDFELVEIRREWQNIDILLIDEKHKFVVIIENKLFSNEHSSQLERYWKIVTREFPGWSVLGTFLSPEGLAPSEEQYCTVSYQHICEILKKLLAARVDRLQPDVRVLIQHYVQMLRRHIVSESEIADLCRKIYRKHQRALDLIYEYRLDLQDALRAHIEAKIKNNPHLILEHSVKSEIRFSPVAWANFMLLNEGEGWHPSNRILVFAVLNRPTRVSIVLVIGPGPESTRQRLLAMAQQHEPPFKSAYRNLNQKFNNIFTRTVLTKKDLESLDVESITKKFDEAWEKFLQRDLQAFAEIVKQQDWLKD